MRYSSTTLILLAIAIMIFGVLSDSSWASVPGRDPGGIGGGRDNGVEFPRIEGEDPAAGPAHLVRYLYVLGLGLGGVLAFAMIAIAGLQWTLSGANPSIQEDAKDRIRNAIFGLLLLLGAFIILNTINPELVRLRDPDLRGIRVPDPAVVDGTQPTHLACVNFQCVRVHSRDPRDRDRCREDRDCAADRKTHACLIAVGGTFQCTNQYTSLAECQADTRNCPRHLDGSVDCVPINECPVPTPVVTECRDARGRPIEPLTPLAPGSLAEQMDQGRTPRLIWADHPGVSPEARANLVTLRRAFDRLQAAGNRRNPRIIITAVSAYRPADYQRHLWEIRDRWCTRGLSANTHPNCAALRRQVEREINDHFAGRTCDNIVVGRPPNRHSMGIAVDVSGFPRRNRGGIERFNQLRNEAQEHDDRLLCLEWPVWATYATHLELVRGCAP